MIKLNKKELELIKKLTIINNSMTKANIFKYWGEYGPCDSCSTSCYGGCADCCDGLDKGDRTGYTCWGECTDSCNERCTSYCDSSCSDDCSGLCREACSGTATDCTLCS